jgi:DNA mismatch endonuclease (patch repair protein)
MASVQWKKQSLVPKNAAATAMGKANPSKNTKPEVNLRRELHRLGYRFRKHYRVVDGNQRPPEVDIAFTKLRLAVEVMGVFWHGRKKEYRPKHNSEYWEKKFADNIARDKRNARRLRRAGWLLCVVWDDWSMERQINAVGRAYGRAKKRYGQVAPKVPRDGGTRGGVVQTPGLPGGGNRRGRVRAGAVDGVQRVAAQHIGRGQGAPARQVQ